MPLTNADYLANPQPPSSDLITHFTSLGASRERAERLAKFVKARKVGRALIKPAALLAVVCLVWVVYALWLAFNASPSTPRHDQMLWPSIAALILGMIIAISRAAGFTTGPFWEAEGSIPRELASAPRRAVVQRVPLGGVFAGIGVACAIAIGGLTVPEVYSSSLLQRDGVETTGKIVSRSIRKGKSRSYLVTYRYTAGGMVLQNSARVREPEYDAMTEGTTVPVTYSATNPLISKPRSRAEIRGTVELLTPLIAIVGGMIVLGILMTLLMAYAQQQTATIATRGVAVLARVTQVDRHAARYSYDTNAGVIDAKSTFGKQRPAPMPVEGETYVVLYDPDNPRRSLPLAMLQDVQFA